LDVLIFPAQPYSAHLAEAADDDAVPGAVRRLTKTDIEKRRDAIAHPFTGPVRDVRSDEDLALKAWLKANPAADLPAWDATEVGNGLPSAWVPRAWIGRTADRFLHLMQESGNGGPIKTTTLAASTSHGRVLGVTEHTAVDSSGRDMFVWTYIYQATVAGRPLTTLLAICEADLVTMSDDEHQLRTLEQQLAHAWTTRDRSTIERILAREWTVMTSDGTIASRTGVLAATFDSNARIVEAMTTDDDGMTVRLFEGTAVVRGSTVATVASAGTRQANAVRFTDVFIKREGTWQMVASHQTSVAR
jgi:hypothetical protein